MSNANSIKVVARFRPQNKVELASGGQPIVTFPDDDTCAINVGSPSWGNQPASYQLAISLPYLGR